MSNVVTPRRSGVAKLLRLASQASGALLAFSAVVGPDGEVWLTVEPSSADAAPEVTAWTDAHLERLARSVWLDERLGARTVLVGTARAPGSVGATETLGAVGFGRDDSHGRRGLVCVLWDTPTVHPDATQRRILVELATRVADHLDAYEQVLGTAAPAAVADGMATPEVPALQRLVYHLDRLGERPGVRPAVVLLRATGPTPSARTAGCIARAAEHVQANVRAGDVLVQVGPTTLAVGGPLADDEDSAQPVEERLAAALRSALTGTEDAWRVQTSSAVVAPAIAAGSIGSAEELVRQAWYRLQPVADEPPVAAVAEVPQVATEHADGGRPSLSALAVRGGAYMVGREGIGMIIRLVGVTIAVRAIGPSGYGIYSAALAFASVAAIIAQLGVEVYLIRKPGELTRRDYDRAYTLLLCSSAVVMAVCLAGTFAIGSWLRPVGVLLPLRVLLLSIPVNVLWAPGQAKIERRFGYREMGWLEIGGDLALYGTAIPLALLHAGAWALVAGYCAWQTFLFVGSMVLSGLVPRWNWSMAAMRAMVRQGMSLSAIQWTQGLSGVVNSMVTGTFAGAAGVGYVAFALRLVDVIGFATRASYRLGLVAMSKVPDSHRQRLRNAIERGSVLQLVALGVPFACFGVASPWLIPLIFGHAWEAAIPTYSVLALAAVLNGPSIIFGTFLLSRGHSGLVVVSSFISLAVLAGTAVPLVAWLGPVGFGWATLLSLVDMVYLDRLVRRTTDVGYGMMIAFAAILAPPILFPLVPMPYALLALLPLGLLAVIPALRHESLQITGLVRSSIIGGVA